MSVTPTTDAAQTAQTTAGTRNSKTIAGNFDQFLLLLTTQLKNQNPLDPLNTNEFTQQLVQFASVEQQIKTNDTLSALVSSTQASTVTMALSFVGAEVTADGAASSLKGGKAEWTLNAARAASEASIVVKDRSGNVVYKETRALAAGAQKFTWDGRTSTGSTAPDGDYTISVTARDTTGQTVSVNTEITGRVDGVDLSGSAPVLTVGSIKVPLTGVKSIRRAA
ncbi:flagellar hook capping FlgD N-terminal domain-containing protein [Chelatococcus sp. SYSU_G07232]|uniref:Basal-body rod modification protein FlgD n=1 Tax=Chelatococcus albus TaxID=3047466 RepID=A0ABT7AFF6_9HYPH|nr:flagellar hook capping FlgD N-terminal domain-containing protein [Chelatococcus sp. SYSU_G07232]MDJ1158118.1 flagellar hook capping FlgD N-terminal domain-containing protein [Chelatococcus sp. SYSU_G07232]